jgi:hypothetical protein
MTKLVVKNGKIVKVDSELQVSRYKVILAACDFIGAWYKAEHDKVGERMAEEMEAGAELEVLRRSVCEYHVLVREDEERKGVERST